MALLELSGVSVQYGEIEALRGVSFSIEEGAVVALLGSNGAGKSTTLRAISGLVAARSGKIGDGKIFVYDVAEAIRIRNDDRGDGAL